MAVPPANAVDARAEYAWTSDEVRRVGYRAVDIIADYLERLPAGPAFRPVPAELGAALLTTPLPRSGEAVDDLLDRFAQTISPYPFGNGHPRFFGWVNSPPAVLGVFMDALAATMNPSVAGGNHAAVWLELQVLEWFKTLLGFPASSMGLLVSGGSSAALTALTVARWRACASRDWDVRSAGLQTASGQRVPRLIAYKGAEGHGCNQKAIELLGIGRDNIRVVPHDDALRLDAAALDRMLIEDLAAGHAPVAVIASAGTVNTGAIDPLDAIADVCRRHDVWLHVDAAYGGAAILTEAYRDALAGLARADSIALDPHKWMYVPVDAGLVLVRDAAAMRDAFSLVPPYLRTDGDRHGVQGPIWFSEYGAEQTRPFRALKVWALLRHFGVDGYRSLIEHDLALAAHLARRIGDSAGWEMWEPRGLSIVCFRAVPDALATRPDERDALNRRILTDVQLGGVGFVSGTVLESHFWLRACIVNPLATAADVDMVFDAARDAQRRLTTRR